MDLFSWKRVFTSKFVFKSHVLHSGFTSKLEMLWNCRVYDDAVTEFSSTQAKAPWIDNFTVLRNYFGVIFDRDCRAYSFACHAVYAVCFTQWVDFVCPVLIPVIRTLFDLYLLSRAALSVALQEPSKHIHRTLITTLSISDASFPIDCDASSVDTE